MLIAMMYVLSKEKNNFNFGTVVIGFIIMGLIVSAIAGIDTIIYNTIARELNIPQFSFWYFMVIVDLMGEVRSLIKLGKEKK